VVDTPSVFLKREVMDRRAVDLIYAPPKAEEIRKKSKKSGRKATKIRFNPL